MFCFSLQQSISQNKLKAFTIGQMNLASKNLSRVEKEELKRKEEEKKTADVLKDFVASFEGGGKSSVKTFVRGGVVNSGKSKLLSMLI